MLIARAFVSLGIKKIRLTGGEPLVRKGIEGLVASLAEIEGLEKICMTTNGTLLPKMASSLYKAGLSHVNISLDTLQPQRYASLTGRDSFYEVWTGIMKALELGFKPVKINVVAMKGINDHEFASLARLALKYPLQVRFIEFMPVGNNSAWSNERVITAEAIKEMVEARIGTLVPLARKASDGPAMVFKLPDGPGEIGFISALSNHFCASCNRLRLTANGKLRLCLFSDREVDVKSFVRSKERGKLKDFLQQAVDQKPEGYLFLGQGQKRGSRKMHAIGG